MRRSFELPIQDETLCSGLLFLDLMKMALTHCPLKKNPVLENLFPVTVLPTMVVSVLLGLLIVFFIFSFFLQYFVCVHLYVDIMLIHIPVVIGIISILICSFYRGEKYTHVCAKLKLMFEFLYDL
jgi:hypothetical protein